MNEGTLRHYSASDGVRLAVREFGKRDPSKLPVVCLHGLTRNSRDFVPLANHLADKAGRHVFAFDLRGRGQSDPDDDWTNYNVRTEANDILAGMAALGLEHAMFIGTSRGGLIMHLLVGMRPGVMKAGILNDIGPELAGEGLAHIKYYLLEAPSADSRDDVLPLAREIHGPAFPALSDEELERFAFAGVRDEDGKVRSDFHPDLLKGVEAIDLSREQPNFWKQFDGLAKMPLLVIRGENTKLLERRTLDEMKKRDPDLEVIEVAGQGHPPMLEHGDLPVRIAEFLDRAEAKVQH